MDGDKASEVLIWSVQPWRKAPQKLIVLVGFAVLCAGFGILIFRNVLFGVAGFAIILGSTAEFWMGTSFRLDAKGATSRTGLSVTSMEWEAVRRVDMGSNLVKLSPLDEASRLDEFRGVRLRVEDMDRDGVLEFVKGRLNEDVRFVEV
jgi:hypothetical protein